jgi:hypothetical protein
MLAERAGLEVDNPLIRRLFAAVLVGIVAPASA